MRLRLCWEWLSMNQIPTCIIKKKRPAKKTKEFAQKHEETRLDRGDSIKAQCNGKDIPYKGKPGEQGKPKAPSVNTSALFLQRFGLDMKPFLYPFPTPQPTYAVGGESAQPVTQSACNKACHRGASRQKDSGIECVGREGNDCCGQEGTDKKTPHPIGLKKIEHNEMVKKMDGKP